MIYNSSNISYWLGILVSIIVVGVIIQTGMDIVTQQTRCFNSLVEQYPDVACGSSNVVYCEWQNKTYNVVMYREEGKVWCDLTDYKDIGFEEYSTNLGMIFVLIIIATIIIGLVGLIPEKKVMKKKRKK